MKAFFQSTINVSSPQRLFPTRFVALNWYFLINLFFPLTLLIACHDPLPIVQLSAAKKMISSAESYHASQFAPDRLALARLSLHKAHDYLAYNKMVEAQALANMARIEATEARLVARAGKAVADTQEQLELLQTQIELAMEANTMSYTAKEMHQIINGQKRAQLLYNKGYRSLQQLRQANEVDESMDIYVQIITWTEQARIIAQRANDQLTVVLKISDSQIARLHAEKTDINNLLSVMLHLEPSLVYYQQIANAKQALVLTQEDIDSKRYAKAFWRLSFARKQIYNAMAMTSLKVE